MSSVFVWVLWHQTGTQYSAGANTSVVVEVRKVFVMGCELLYVLVVHPKQLTYWRNLHQLDNLISSLFKGEFEEWMKAVEFG